MAPTVNAAPGGSAQVAAPPSKCINGGTGECQAEYLELNGLSMEDLLKRLETGGKDHLIALREHVHEAAGVNQGRLITAMDAVYYRNYEPAIRSIGEQIVQADMEAFIQFEVDQREVIRKYMAQDTRPRRPASSSSSAASGGSGGTPFPDSALKDWGTAEQMAFKKAVYNAVVASAQARGRKFNADLARDQLGAVENGQRMRKDAAEACVKLLTQARADLTAAQGSGDDLATKASDIAAGSGYRSATEELRIWESLFPQYYDQTATERGKQDDGEHGAKAVTIMVNWYSGRKAAPGFGNHTNGIAMDFMVKQGGVALGANTSQNKAWMDSWFHKWLVDHAGTDFNFKPIATEAWHWEYKP